MDFQNYQRETEEIKEQVRRERMSENMLKMSVADIIANHVPIPEQFCIRRSRTVDLPNNKIDYRQTQERMEK